jgi:hypothetical protein
MTGRNLLPGHPSKVNGRNRKPVSTIQVIMKPGFTYRKKQRATIPFPEYDNKENEMLIEPVESAPYVFGPSPEFFVIGSTNITIFKLDDHKKIWSATGFNIDDFDHSNGGLYVGSQGEAVICDHEFCLCNFSCYCENLQFVETRLYCDGKFMQYMVYIDPLDKESLLKIGKHNIMFKACGLKGCRTCKGVDFEDLF